MTNWNPKDILKWLGARWKVKEMQHVSPEPVLLHAESGLRLYLLFDGFHARLEDMEYGAFRSRQYKLRASGLPAATLEKIQQLAHAEANRKAERNAKSKAAKEARAAHIQAHVKAFDRITNKRGDKFTLPLDGGITGLAVEVEIDTDNESSNVTLTGMPEAVACALERLIQYAECGGRP